LFALGQLARRLCRESNLRQSLLNNCTGGTKITDLLRQPLLGKIQLAMAAANKSEQQGTN